MNKKIKNKNCKTVNSEMKEYNIFTVDPVSEVKTESYMVEGNNAKELCKIDEEMASQMSQSFMNGPFDELKFHIGVCCLNGSEGMEENPVEAVKWFRMAADHGDVNACVQIGVHYADGYGVEKDMTQAYRWLRVAAICAKPDDLKPMQCLADFYAEEEGWEQGDTNLVKWCQNAAEQGNSFAQRLLGVYYAIGKGVEQDDAEAVKWYLKAAEQGDLFAQWHMAFCYNKGIGVEKNDTEKAKWYLKGAEQGDSLAQEGIAYCYAEGCGVEKNEAEAAKWYLKAAEQGDSYAQRVLTYYYAEGSGVEKNEAEALKWFQKAAELGDTFAQGELCDMQKKSQNK